MTVTIIGVGLIGGSMALALKEGGSIEKFEEAIRRINNQLVIDNYYNIVKMKMLLQLLITNY